MLPDITLSLVSHGQLALVQEVLAELAHQNYPKLRKVILTHNLPENRVIAPNDGWPFVLIERTNLRPLGFGANHNRAFALCDTAHFCLINPDISLMVGDLWQALQFALEDPQIACVYPLLINKDGSAQDSERSLPTPAALWRRRILKQSERRLDWVSAAFWLLRSEVFRQLRGFDERFFMYCEDTDFCLRMRLAGWHMRKAQVPVMHIATRRSHRNLQHLAWHVDSLMRLWTSPVLRTYLRLREGLNDPKSRAI